MKKIDVIIFGGQSNMQGQSETVTNTDVIERAYEYKYVTNTAMPLKTPVGENIKYDMCCGEMVTKTTDLKKWLSEHVLGASCYGNTNLVPEFCRAYLQESNEMTEVLAVHAAKGSTQIHEWLPGTDGYKALLTKSRAALDYAQQNYEVKKIFFVWLQGESDAIAGVSKDRYKENLEQLNDSLQVDLNVDKFGIIRVGSFTRDYRDWEIISAQSEICIENKEFLMLTEIATKLNDTEDCMNPYVKGHYSAKGLEILGSLAGKSLAQYKNGGE